MMPSVLRVNKVSEDVKAPVYDAPNQYVFFAAEDILVPAGKMTKVRTGVKIAFPSTYGALVTEYGEFLALSGLMDSDYRGEIVGTLFSPEKDIFVKKDDPIMRVNLLEIALPEVVSQVEETDGSSTAIVK